AGCVRWQRWAARVKCFSSASATKARSWRADIFIDILDESILYFYFNYQASLPIVTGIAAHSGALLHGSRWRFLLYLSAVPVVFRATAPTAPGPWSIRWPRAAAAR